MTPTAPRTFCPVDDCARPGYRVSDQDLATYADEGWVILRGVVRPDCVAGLRDEVLDVIAARNMADSYLAQTHEYLAGGFLDRWINSQVLAAVAEAFMGPRARLYLPFTAVKGPGQGQFTFHQDNNYTFLDGPALNCWTALTPMRTENGCLRLVSRSHRDGTVASTASEVCTGHRRVQQMPESWVDAHMEPGDVCVFHRLTVHGSGPNQTAEPRVGYAVQYRRHDTHAIVDGQRLDLDAKPRYPTLPVPALTGKAHRGE